MRRISRCLLSGVLAGVLAFSPVSMVTVSAHGHHGGGNEGHHGGQSTSNVTYYYCGGHEAHCHDNGVCPYAGETVEVEDPYYYCGGHEAHHHENGECPYAGEAGGTVGTEEPYYYCGGHEAHHHENGECPYAGEAGGTVGTDAPYYYCGGHEAHHHENGVCPYAGVSVAPTSIKDPDSSIETSGYSSTTQSRELMKRRRNNLAIKCKNICIGRRAYLN